MDFCGKVMVKVNSWIVKNILIELIEIEDIKHFIVQNFKDWDFVKFPNMYNGDWRTVKNSNKEGGGGGNDSH